MFAMITYNICVKERAINIDDCDSNPCENGGSCTYEIVGYSCICVAGYTGDTFSVNFEDYDPNP